MPSQEEYLDNLLKGIETENTETEVTKEPKMTGTEEETAKAPETPEPVEESGTQVDMMICCSRRWMLKKLIHQSRKRKQVSL